MMDEEIRQALNEVREMKQMCGNINMKLTNIVTQRGQDFKKKLEAEYQRGFEDGKAVNDKIEVGDEVIYNGTTKCVVVTPETDEKYASLFDCNGIHYSADHCECKKTGRHFDIASILEDMRHD